jgi:hypothetical protein
MSIYITELCILSWQNIDIDQIVLEHYEKGGTPNSTPNIPSKSTSHIPFRSTVDLNSSQFCSESPETSKKEPLCSHGSKVCAHFYARVTFTVLDT